MVTGSPDVLEFGAGLFYPLNMMFDLLLHNALLLTLEPGQPPLAAGYVAVHKGAIVALGQAAPGQNLPPAVQVIDVQGNLVMPGLVNCHCHGAMTLFRGMADDLPLEAWLYQHIFPAETRWVDYDFVYVGAQLAAAELIRGGVTTVADAYFWEAGARQALAEAGLRAVAAQGVIDFPAPGVPEAADNLRVAQDFITSGPESGSLITSTLFCHAPYTCSAATLQGAKAISRSANLPFFLHLAETRQEDRQIREQTGLSPVAYLDSLDLLDPDTVAVHVVWADKADRRILAQRGVKICHCPESNLKLASGIAPVAELLALDLTVGLGTDGAASNNNLNLWGEMSLATKLHKLAGLDPTVLPARQVVEMATRGGAGVLGLEGLTGSLSPGKEADLIIVELRQPHLTPLYDPYSHLVYAAGPADVRDVMVQGRWLMRNRELLTLDWPAIRAAARQRAQKIQPQVKRT